MGLTCGAKCARFLLIIFNIIFWLSGCALMVLGILLVIDKDNKVLLDLLEISAHEPLLRISAYFFIGVGAFVFIVGFIGCCGAVQQSQCCLVLYFLLLLLILAAEVAAGILTIVYKSDLEASLKKELKTTLEKNYTGEPDNAATIYFNAAQEQLGCCGVDGPDDYLESMWRNNSQYRVPVSCCTLAPDSTPLDNVIMYSNQDVCQTVANNNQRYNEGCYKRVEEWFAEHSDIITGVGIGIGLLEIFGMIFAICLCRSISEERSSSS